MDPLDSRTLSRRRLLALGAASVGALTLAHTTSVAAAIAPRVAPGLRPEGLDGHGTASVCAMCGREDHSTLGGACLPRRMRG